MSTAFPTSTAIVGIGESRYGKRGSVTDVSEFHICCEAIKAAAEDAGLDIRDIDGFCSFADERPEPVRIQQTLGIPQMRFSNLVWGAAGGGCSAAVMNAALAVHAGICRHVVVYRSLCQGQFARFGHYRPRAAGGSYMSPFGLLTPAQYTALTYRRYMHEHGVTEQQLSEVPIAFRSHALRNPRAVQFGKPLTSQEYFSSRYIATPFRLYDCCLETDGACALIVTTAERAADLRQRPARILAAAQASNEGWGLGPAGSHNMHLADYGTTNSRELAKALFGMAGIKPQDVDVAQFYDAFSGLVVMALEDFGFAERGGGGAFVEAGNLRWSSGKLPTNTSGGMLSEAYLHGLNLVTEAVRQIRGQSTAQVDDVEISFVNSGGGAGHKSALILST
jgi:acetyl-CoA acetyltransferase